MSVSDLELLNHFLYHVLEQIKSRREEKKDMRMNFAFKIEWRVLCYFNCDREHQSIRISCYLMHLSDHSLRLDELFGIFWLKNAIVIRVTIYHRKGMQSKYEHSEV